jgi:hypothetical protein
MLDMAYHLLNTPRSKLCDGSIAGRMTTKLRCYKNGLLTYRAILEDGDAFLRDFQESLRLIIDASISNIRLTTC